MPAKKLMKQVWYPRPHDQVTVFNNGLEDTQTATIVPIAHYDEGLGSPASFNAHPEHASFTETDSSNCYPDSRINLLTSRVEMSLTKPALETDKLHVVNVGFMPIMMSFKEDYIAVDELSSVEVQDVLELQTESTDRQGGALYNGTDTGAPYTNSSLVGADVPFLTTDAKLEKVDFDIDLYYDSLHYKTIAGKLKNCSGGIKWIKLTKNHPYTTFNIKIRGKIKRMNPYTYFGVLILTPRVDSEYQIPIGTDTTAIAHVQTKVTSRYNEWHQNFNMEKL